MKFSANLGFLWADRPLPDAIHAAHAAGVDAVELHWPYDTPAAEVKAALDATGLPLLGLNTRRGDVADHGFRGDVDDELARASLGFGFGVAERIFFGAVGLRGRAEEDGHGVGADGVEEGVRRQVDRAVGRPR